MVAVKYDNTVMLHLATGIVHEDHNYKLHAYAVHESVFHFKSQSCSLLPTSGLHEELVSCLLSASLTSLSCTAKTVV